MIKARFGSNIITIYDEDRNDDIIFDLRDVVSIKRYGKSKIILPPLGLSSEVRKVDTTTKILITLINKEDIILECGIFDRDQIEQWETAINDLYEKIAAQWRKYKRI